MNSFTSSYHFLLLVSRSVMSNSLRPNGLQHASLPCPSPSPEACSHSWPLSQQYHPTISSSVVPFSHLQSFPASGSSLVSWLFTSCGQRSFSFNISPSNEYSGLISFRIDWLDLLAVQRTLQSLLQHHNLIILISTVASNSVLLYHSHYVLVH